MLTRRTATVTISAPDASTAAAFCSTLLYLPVTTISREVKVRPATVQLSALICSGAFTSASADDPDDFIIVPVFDRDLAKQRAWHHREVALDRDSLRVEPDFADHVGDAHRPHDPAMLAVDANPKASIDGH